MLTGLETLITPGLAAAHANLLGPPMLREVLTTQKPYAL